MKISRIILLIILSMFFLVGFFEIPSDVECKVDCMEERQQEYKWCESHEKTGTGIEGCKKMVDWQYDDCKMACEDLKEENGIKYEL
jgi:hypothetical protein